MAHPPDMEKLLKKVRRLHVESRKAVVEYMSGQFQSAFRGNGIEFHEVRDYRPGDEINAIDWNVTARTGSLHVKTFVEEREQCLIFLVDASASAAFGSAGCPKSETMAEVCALVAFSALSNNDRVGLVLFSDRVEKQIPPRKGIRHTLRLIRELLSFEAAGKGTRIESALKYLFRVQRKKAIVFLISDFLDQGYEKAVKLAAKRYDLIGVRVIDPREKALAGGGVLRLRDLESGALGEVDLGDKTLRERYALKAEERDEWTRRCFADVDADFLEVEAGAPCAGLLRTFFSRRSMRRRRS